MSDTIYILRNPAFPDLIKIGRTDNGLKQRIDELSRPPGIPARFECYYACEVAEGRGADIEKRLHFCFGDHRANPKREFFEVNPERVQRILEAFAVQEVKVEESINDDTSDTIKSDAKRGRFQFSMVRVGTGATLSFVKDESITCVVSDDRKVIFDGEKMYLTTAAIKAFSKIGDDRTTLRGPDYWMYNGETLSELRDRMEDEDEDDEFFNSIPQSREPLNPTPPPPAPPSNWISGTIQSD